MCFTWHYCYPLLVEHHSAAQHTTPNPALLYHFSLIHPIPIITSEEEACACLHLVKLAYKKNDWYDIHTAGGSLVQLTHKFVLPLETGMFLRGRSIIGIASRPVWLGERVDVVGAERSGIRHSKLLRVGGQIRVATRLIWMSCPV